MYICQCTDCVSKAKEAFIKNLETIQFIGEQGLPLRHSTDADSLFVKLLKLRARDSATLESWMQRRDKYCSHEIQNEILNILASEVSRVLSANIRNNKYFSLILDSTTDISTKEQN